MLGEPSDYDPKAIVDEIFAALEPPGVTSVEEIVSRMETVARQADRLARQGQGDMARRAYYSLTRGCVDFCEAYGAHDLFPPDIPYGYAVTYRDLAIDYCRFFIADTTFRSDSRGARCLPLGTFNDRGFMKGCYT